MKISAKTDYACRALIELSLHWPQSTPLQVSAIAERQQIPMTFLTQILLTLKQLGLVESIRGKTGGYVLLKPPKEIYLKEVLVGLGAWEPESGRSKSVLDPIWNQVNEAVEAKIAPVHFGAICNRVRQGDKALMFDI